MNITSCLNRFLAVLTLTAFFFISILSQAQEGGGSAKNKSPFPVKYRSLTDERMLLRTITLAPVYDNLGGVYSKPIQQLLMDLLQSDKAWGFAEIQGHNSRFIENYDLNPNDVIEVLAKTNAQGLLTAFITKGPRGLNAKLKLFTHDEGLILLEETIEDLNAFEISKLREQFTTMYQNLKNKLPYRGYVLSRRGQDVTVSVGTVNGVQVGQELSIAQIIKLNRHPKLKLLVGVEKEIIARVVVTKADPYLSFAQIVFEKETGVVDVGAKVLPIENINYPRPELNTQGVVVGDLSVNSAQIQKRPELRQGTTPITTDPLTAQRRSELFDRNNSMGSVKLQGVVLQYGEKQNLIDGSNISSTQNFAPGLNLGAQYNFYENFQAQISYLHSQFSLDNGLTGSAPFSLNSTFAKMSGLVGYSYHFDETDDEEDGTPTEEISDNYGLVFSAALGFVNFKTDIENSSPVAYTSSNTNMMLVQAKASIPLNTEKPLHVGGLFELAFSPTYSESPVNSGNASASFTSLGFFAVYELNDNFNLIGDFNINSISTQFTGTGTRSNPVASGKIDITTQQFGFEYLF